MEAAIKIIGLFVLILAFTLAYRGPAPKLSPDTISGVYTNEHQITAPNNAPEAGEVMDTVSDKLTLERQRDGSIKFHTELTFSYYHTCEMDAIARPIDGGYEYVQPEKEIITERCKLKISINDEAITFEDPRQSCRDMCGARGYYDQVSFKRSTRQPLENPASKTK